MPLLRSPKSVFILITSLCNLRCKHCSVYSDETGYFDLDTETWITFFRELANIKVFRVKLSGGEPFMREDIWELMDTLHQLPMRFSINTNASLIDSAAAERLNRYHKLDDIMVSLDGASPESHDALRGEGSFQEMYSGVENLLRFPFSLGFYCTINRYNYQGLGEVVRLVHEWGEYGIKFNDLLPEGMAMTNYEELSLDREQWVETLETLRELKQDYSALVSGTVLDQGDIYDEIKACDREQGQNGESNTLSGCGALIDECAVWPDGCITPCDRIDSIKGGNIQEGRFAEIWCSSDVFNNFRKRREVLLSELEECQGCSYQEMCTGGCAAAAIALYGKVVAKNPLGCYRIFSGQEQFHVL